MPGSELYMHMYIGGIALHHTALHYTTLHYTNPGLSVYLTEKYPRNDILVLLRRN